MSTRRVCKNHFRDLASDQQRANSIPEARADAHDLLKDFEVALRDGESPLRAPREVPQPMLAVQVLIEHDAMLWRSWLRVIGASVEIELSLTAGIAFNRFAISGLLRGVLLAICH